MEEGEVMVDTGLLQCYNKGCGQKFKEEDNRDEACTYHPGGPVFHDAMKGWSCCKKRSTDFTDFLNTPGCTKGRHNPTKPPEPEKPPIESLKIGEEIIVKGPPPPKVMRNISRPPDDLPFKLLRVKVANSLSSLLARLRKQQQQEEEERQEKEKAEQQQKINSNSDEDSNTNEDSNSNGGEEVAIGTKCKNYTCEALYVGPDTNFTTCQYHPGVAIFHDGYKFWSCCQRRTSDFNEFQRQEGCTTGDHVWFKEVKKAQTCRVDWHQTGSTVVIAFYAKACLPEKSCVEANPTNIRVSLVFDNGKTEFAQDIPLHGVVTVEKSSVDMMGTKVEVKLKKADPISWSDLRFKEPVISNNN